MKNIREKLINIDFALSIYDLAILSGRGSDIYNFSHYYDYLYYCGWTDREFDEFLLNSIDNSWTIVLN